MKKRICFLLVVALLFACCPAVTLQAAAVGEIFYNYRIENGGAVIEAFDRLPAGDVVIPDTLGGYPVTRLEDYLFYQANELTSVTIPATVEYIGDCVFYYCEKLTGIYIDERNPYFSNDEAGVLFNKNKTVLLAAPGAYKGSYTIADTVKEIGKGAFKGCNGLTQVVFPTSVESIGLSAFEQCDSLRAVTIPGNISVIGRMAFFACDGLRQVNIGSGVSFIEDYAFSWCDNLTEVTLPETISHFTGLAFGGCSGLNAIKVHPENPWYTDMDGIVYSKDMTQLCCVPSGYTGSYVAPDSLTEVGQGAFMECMGLTSVVLPDNVLVIGEHAFYSCYNLEWMYAGKGVQIIWDNAFSQCVGLKKIMLGDRLLRVADYAFANCARLTDIYYLGTGEQWNGIFLGEYNDSLQYAQVHFGEDMPLFIPGDLDNNQIVDEDDAIYLLQYVLMPEFFPVYQPVDFDGNRQINEDDAIYLLQHVLMPNLFPLQ